MSSELDEQIVLNDGYIFEVRNIHKKGHNIENLHGYRDLFFEFSASSLCEKALFFSEQSTALLKYENSKYSTTLEDIYTNRSHRLKLSLDVSRKIRTLLSKAATFFQESISPSSVGAFDFVALLCMALQSDPTENAQALIKSISHQDWQWGSSDTYYQIFSALRVDQSSLPFPLRHEYCLGKFVLALRACRLSSIVDCLLCVDSKDCVLDNFKPPTLVAKKLYTEESFESFLLRSYTLPFPIKGSSIRYWLDNISLTLFDSRRMVCYEMAGLMETRLQKIKEESFELSLTEQVVSCVRDTLITVQPTISSPHRRKCEYTIKIYNLVSKKVLRSGRLSFCGSNFYSWNSGKCLFSFCIDTLTVLRYTVSPILSRRCLYVYTVPLDKIFGNPEEFMVNSEGLPLLRNPSCTNGKKALYFTKKTSVSVGCITLNGVLSPFCIEFWACPCAVSGTQILISIGDKAVDEIFIEIEACSGGVLWRGGARNPRLGQSFAMFVTSGKAYLGLWSHVALNFTGTTWQLWLNERFVAVQPALLSSHAIHSAKCTLGKCFIGFLSEVRIWCCVRTAIELLRDANKRLDGLDKNLCGYFRLDEGGGNFVIDYSFNRDHVLLEHGELQWCTCPPLPIENSSSTKLQCFIPDFLPLSANNDFESVHFSVSRYYYNVAVSMQGLAVCLYQYSRTTLALVAQTHLHLTGNMRIVGIWSNSIQKSIQFGVVTERTSDQLVVWEIGEYNQFCLYQQPEKECTLWSYARKIILQAAEYAQPYLNSERFLIDGISWRLSIPTLVADDNPNTLGFLLELAEKAIGERDKELSHAACVLLDINLLFRRNSASADLLEGLGPFFSDAFDLLAVGSVDNSETRLVVGLRDRIVKMAFSSLIDNSVLLEICCQCFLSDSSRIQFINKTSGKRRVKREEKLFWCLVSSYNSLWSYHELYERNEHIEVLFKALILESVFQVDIGVQQKKHGDLEQISRCLELLQELLFDKMSGMPEDEELGELCTRYTNTLLRACQKIIESAKKTLQVYPKVGQPLLQYLKLTPIGSLLTSFTLSLPSLPVSILVTCQIPIQECQTALLSLARSLQGKALWMTELCVAMTFSLCLTGCLLIKSDFLPIEGARGEDKDTLELKYLNIMCGGPRKCGTERDLLIKNMQKGVGPIGVAFEKLQLRDTSGLRMVRNEELKSLERYLMAAICALTLPTSALKNATPESLELAFQYVLRMRPYIMAKCQESKENLLEIRSRAVFLAQFEPCVHTEAEPNRLQSNLPMSVHKSTRKVMRKDLSSWRKLFKNWKIMRLLKTLTSSQDENSSTQIGSDIVDFLQSNAVKCSDIKKSLEFRTRKAHHRLSGLLMLKQLIDEARVNASLSCVILPVISKNLCAWHYSKGVECCSSEDIFRLHGSFFQLFDAVLNKYLDNCSTGQPLNSQRERYHWGRLLLSFFISLKRQIDFQKVRCNLVGRAFKSIMRDLHSNGFEYRPRVNGVIPTSLRETKLDCSLASVNLRIGESGLTIKASGGRGSCLVPCTWYIRKDKESSYTFYYEVYIVDLLPGAICAIGVGPLDCRLFRLPGWEPNSFSLLSDDGVLFSGNPRGSATGYSFVMGDVVGCGWNVARREIYWTKNGRLLLSVSSGEAATFNPVVGLEGKAIIQLNFGNSPFYFDAWDQRPLQILPTQHRGYFRWTGTDAWDTYRVFTLRAATCLHEAAARGNMSTEALRELATCVEDCLETLSEEIMYTCRQAQSIASNPQSAIMSYLRALLRHCSVLTKLLGQVPRKHITASRVIPLSNLLQKIALSLLQSSTEVERSMIFVPLSYLVDSDILTTLLTAWYYTMNLIPSDTYESQQGSRLSSLYATNSRFLSVLLGLANRLCFDNCFSSSKKRDPTSQVMTSFTDYLPESVYWIALALLQHLNGAGVNSKANDSGESSSSAPLPHAWSEVLNEWVISVLSKTHQPNQEVLLALSILGGGARLAAPGDIIDVMRTNRRVSRAALVNISMSEEICEVIEDGVHRVLPLRLVNLIIAEDESSYYPLRNSSLHLKQATEVLSLAVRLMASEKWSNFDGSTFLSYLLPILWRCSARQVIEVPKSIISLLSLSVKLPETTPVDLHQIRTEKVLIESCGTGRGYYTTPPFSPINNASHDLSSTFDTYDLTSPINFFAPQWHSLTYSSDHDIEVNNEEHHGNIGSNETENLSDEISSSMDNLNLGVSTSSDALLKEESFHTAFMRGAYDAIRFDGGYLCVKAHRCVGMNYTIDLQIHILDVLQPQIIFAQLITINTVASVCTKSAKAMEKGGFWVFMARIIDFSVEFGVIPGDTLDSTLSKGFAENVCRLSLTSNDTDQWIRLTFAQSGNSLSLYREGVLQSGKHINSFTGLLFQHPLFFGGLNMDTRTMLHGCLKCIRIYDLAMNQGMVELLQPINLSVLAFTEPHLCLIILAHKDGFRNYSQSPVSLLVDISSQGEVSYLENSTFPPRKSSNICAQELDYGNDPDEQDIYTIDTSGLANFTQTYHTLMKSKRELSLGLLWLSYRRCLKQLIAFYAIRIFLELLGQMDWENVTYPESIDVFGSSSDETSSIKDIVQYTLLTGNNTLYEILQKVLKNIARLNSVSLLTTALCRDALQSVLQIAQREQSVHTYESSHPISSLPRVAREIYSERQNYYQFFFDPRTSNSNIVMTFSMNKAFSSVFAQTPGFALASFMVQLPRVYFDVRTTGVVSQWGYKMFVVSDCLPQLRAVRLLRAVLTTILESDHLDHFPFFKSSAYLKQINKCIVVNTGKTRRILLSCLCDLLLRFEPFNGVDIGLLFSTIHDIRRMAERKYRQHVTTQIHFRHCRFLQVAMECYTFFMDAWHCAQNSSDCAPEESITLTPAEEQILFARRRLEQHMLYRFRENGKESVRLQRASDAHRLHLEWTADLCIARNDGKCASMFAQVSLTRGKWYFEVRIGGTGNSFIGVLLSKVPYQEQITQELTSCFLFNGFTGLLQNADGTVKRIAARETWQHKDYVGVILDMDEKKCHFFINGKDINLGFSFEAGQERIAASAAGPEARYTDFEHSLDDTVFFPYFMLEKNELMFINFGASHFEYEIPCGCLPLDPANLVLGTLLSYNQLRAFQDITIHLLKGGSHPMPPFFYEEADPFAHSIDRKGPAHVSLHSTSEEVQINLLEVKNTGTHFQSVTADCSVLLGCWYYEVTLHTQGLMQIGWIIKGTLNQGSVGDTPESWSIDLFRRMCWHNGVPETLSISRRWSVGDIIGCALNLSDREMTFFLNGRSLGTTPLTSCTFRDLPVGPEIEYVPAISLRAGNQVSFNFGSLPFKCKPDGFNALGVPDSWSERIDAFYSNERTTLTLRRILAMKELSRPMDSREGTFSDEHIRTHLQPYFTVVEMVDSFCQEPGRTYKQITQENLKVFYKKELASAEHTACERSGSDSFEVAELWDRYSILKAVARLAEAVLPLLNINTQNVSPMTRLLLLTRGILFRQLRVSMVDTILNETNVHTEHLRLSINRLKARAEHRDFLSSVFGQTLVLLIDRPPSLFQTNKRFWSTTFMGEGAEDVGGPFREHVNEICQELMSRKLPLFVATANNAHNLGKCRDAFVPAASATGQFELAAYVFIGNLMGGAIRSEEPLSLFFPPLVWKFMCCCPIIGSDLDDVDHICWQCIQEFQDAQSQLGSREAFDEAFDTEYFVTKLSDSSTKELIKNGANVKVTFDRCADYAAALLETRLHEFDLQLSKIREGMLQVVPELVLLLLSPTELEMRVCGQPDFEVSELRKSAVYEGLTKEDRRVLLLWTALEEATSRQRRLFLRFVSGRDRMPVKLRILPLPTPSDPNTFLPRAATCFFAIELPDYTSLEVMKEKLYYSIENCLDIDTDFNARQTLETEGSRLVVRMDEGTSTHPIQHTIFNQND